MVFSSSATTSTTAAANSNSIISASSSSSTVGASSSTLLDPYLHRLPAIYTHPPLVHQHVTHLLSSRPHGSNLLPAMETLIHNDGSSTPTPVLLLRGTIPMQYKGVLYHLPIDLYLPPSYPHVCPTVYVRPVSSMCIKPNHKHVGLDGMVYLPYLAQWKAPTTTTTTISSATASSSRESSNLIELVTWMSRLFGEEPPCFAKPRSSSGGGGGISTSNGSSNGGVGGGIWQQWNSTTTARPPPSSQSKTTTTSSQEVQALEREIAEANRAAEAARRAEALEHRRRRLELEQTERNNRLREEQLLLHEAKLSSLKSKATEEIQDSMKSLFAELGEEIRMELQYQKKLEYGQGQIDVVRNEYETKCRRLREGKRELDMAIDKLEGWLTAVEIFSSSGHDQQQQQQHQPQQQQHQPQPDATITRADLMALPSDTPSAQMLSLSAESNSIDDTIYFLDQALVRNTINLEVFMKEVRRLSKRQFMAKAHMIKIEQTLATERR